MPAYSSDSENENNKNKTVAKLFGRERPLHAVLGGARVADVVLWRNRNVSAAILFGVTAIWFLFAVVEYQFLALVCHVSIAAMLILFIWSNGAALFDRSPPKIPEIILSESAFTKVASTFRVELNRLITNLHEVACGKDLKLFIMVIASLWVLSMIGTYFSSLNLLYLGFLCIFILPAFYERYEQDVDKFVRTRQRNLRKMYSRFDSEVLNKIPRGPVKDKKSS
ncbi:hypothetical protein Scep_023080 [Stephania cephalantha]|uniref:Reticulon-like protein n=1 Tax=Stephania cephalantha TaxID=152367 RepID=A0AAP0F6M3_9MAGN